MRRLGSRRRGRRAAPLRIADVGTGSGAIAVALAVALRRRQALEAVELLAPWTSRRTRSSWPARTRSAMPSRTGSTFEVADLLPPDVRPFELVLANLPYVRRDAIAGLPRGDRVRAGPRARRRRRTGSRSSAGWSIDCRLALVEDGVALLEIGADQGEAIVSLVAERLPGWRCVVELDLAGLPRVARLERATGS